MMMANQLTHDIIHARRDMLRGALLAATGGLLLGQSAQADEAAASAVKNAALHSRGGAGGRRELLTRHSRPGAATAVYLSQGPESYDVDMETQIRQTFDRIGILLKSAGATFANVVIIRSYWVHMQPPTFRFFAKSAESIW